MKQNLLFYITILCITIIPNIALAYNCAEVAERIRDGFQESQYLDGSNVRINGNAFEILWQDTDTARAAFNNVMFKTINYREVKTVSGYTTRITNIRASLKLNFGMIYSKKTVEGVTMHSFSNNGQFLDNRIWDSKFERIYSFQSNTARTRYKTTSRKRLINNPEASIKNQEHSLRRNHGTVPAPASVIVTPMDITIEAVIAGTLPHINLPISPPPAGIWRPF